MGTHITVKTLVNAQVGIVWKYWTKPQHIVKWNNASVDWHTTISENDLRVGGKFLSRMEAKDGSFGFDFSGVYEDVKLNEIISYILDDGRRVKITFINKENKTEIIGIFEAEKTNSKEGQQNGWQNILDNFKKYVEQLTI